MLNEKALRKKLHELGIPDWGSKGVMTKRHQEWLNIYNSNCDASEAVRKTKRVLLRELDEWERTQGGSVNAKESHIMRKDFDGSGYATIYKTQIDDLIASARKGAKSVADVEDAQGNDQQTKPDNTDPGVAQQQANHPNNLKDPAAAPHRYEGNETALSTVRQKVEEASGIDSALPPTNRKAEAVSLKAAVNVQQADVPLGLARSPEDTFGSSTRQVPMFRMPEEPVLDVESSTAI